MKKVTAKRQAPCTPFVSHDKFKDGKKLIIEMGQRNESSAIFSGLEVVWPTCQRFKRTHHHNRMTYWQGGVSNSLTLPGGDH